MSNIDYEINKELGECYLYMGEFDKAEEYYLKAAKSTSEHAAPYLGLAAICVQRGNFDEAYSQYSKAASIESSDKAMAGIGLVQMERGDHSAAFDSFKQALDLNPENMVAMNCLVQEGHLQGRLADVVPVLESSLAVRANDSVFFTLAGCLVALERKDEAKKYLQAILKANPQHTQAQELLDNLA